MYLRELIDYLRFAGVSSKQIFLSLICMLISVHGVSCSCLGGNGFTDQETVQTLEYLFYKHWNSVSVLSLEVIDEGNHLIKDDTWWYDSDFMGGNTSYYQAIVTEAFSNYSSQDLVVGDTVIFSTPSQSSACGDKFEVGIEYVITLDFHPIHEDYSELTRNVFVGETNKCYPNIESSEVDSELLMLNSMKGLAKSLIMRWQWYIWGGVWDY